MTREILTLQIGHLSNYVATTFWNHLDYEQRKENASIDYNSYFTFSTKTNQPIARALIIDYHNGFGNLFDDNRNALVSEDSSIEIIQRPNRQLFWSQELKSRVTFNTKSLLPLTDYWYPLNSEENQFDIFSVGQKTFKTMFDSIEHSLHYLLESCDSLQSFRCLYDVQNSFSGLFSSIEDYLAEECPKRPIWSFPVSDDSTDTASSNLNLSLSLIQSMTVNQMPTIPCLNQTDRVSLALAIQHVLFESSSTLDVLADRLCPMKMNLLKLFWQIPFTIQGKTLFHHLNTQPILPLQHPVACHCFIRGVPQSQLYDSSLYRLNVQTSADLLDLYLNEQHGSKMFRSNNSWVDPLSGSIGSTKYDSAALISALINDQLNSSTFFIDLLKTMKSVSYKTLSKRWQESDFEEESFNQCIHDLNSIEEQFQITDSSI